MKRLLRILFSLAVYAVLVCGAYAQGMGISFGPGPGMAHSGGGCALTLALDGTPGQNNIGVSTTTPTVTLPTTTGTTDFVGLFVYYNITANSVVSVSGGGLTWTKRAEVHSGNNNLDFWWAPATVTLSGQTVTVTLDTASTFTTLTTFAFSGANTSSPFDPNVALPATGTTTQTAVTSNANDVVIGMFSDNSSTGAPDTGAGFTTLGTAGNFTVGEYKILSSTTPGLSVGITGDTIATTIVDAVKRGC